MDPLRYPTGSYSNWFVLVLPLIFSQPSSAWDPDMPGGMKLVIDGDTYSFTTDLCSGGVFFKRPVHIELTCMHGYFLKRPNGCAMRENYIMGGQNYACEHAQKDKQQLFQAFIPMTNPYQPLDHTITLFDDPNHLKNLRRYSYLTGLEGAYEATDSDPAGIIVTNSQKTPDIDLGKLCYKGNAQTRGNSFMAALSRSSGKSVSSPNFFQKNCNSTTAAFIWGRHVSFNFTEGYSGPDFFRDELPATMDDFPEPTADSGDFEIWGGLAYCMQANVTESSNGSLKMAGIAPSIESLCSKEKREIDEKPLEKNSTAELERKSRAAKKSSAEFDALMTCVSSCWEFGTDKCHRLPPRRPPSAVALCPPYCDGPPKGGLGIRRRTFGRPALGGGVGVRPANGGGGFRRSSGIGVRPARKRMPLVRRRYWELPLHLQKPHWRPPMRRPWNPRPIWRPRPRPYRSPNYNNNNNFRTQPIQDQYGDQSMMRQKYMYPRSVQSPWYPTPGRTRRLRQNAPFNRAYNNQRNINNGYAPQNSRKPNGFNNFNGHGADQWSHSNSNSRFKGLYPTASPSHRDRENPSGHGRTMKDNDWLRHENRITPTFIRKPTSRKQKRPVNGIHHHGTMGSVPNHGKMDGMPNQGTMDGMPNQGTMDGMPNQGTMDGMPNHKTMDGMRNHETMGGMRNHGTKGGMRNHGPIRGMPNHETTDDLHNHGNGFVNPKVVHYRPAQNLESNSNNNNGQGILLPSAGKQSNFVSANIDWKQLASQFAAGGQVGQGQVPSQNGQLGNLQQTQLANAIKMLNIPADRRVSNEKTSNVPGAASNDPAISKAAENILRYATTLLGSGMKQGQGASKQGTNQQGNLRQDNGRHDVLRQDNVRRNNARQDTENIPAYQGSEARGSNKVFSNRHRRRLWPNRILGPLATSKKNHLSKRMPPWIRHQPNALPGFVGDKVARDGKGNVYMQISMNA